MAQAIVTPEPVATELLTEAPYAYNGLITTNDALGSGSLVGEGVFVTAAHVIYDDEPIYNWVPAGSVKYFPRHHATLTQIPGGGYSPAAFYKWTSYSTRVQNDESPDGQSSPDTFNVDFAVGYFGGLTTPEILRLHAEVNVDEEYEVGILRDPREKMIIGYPQASPVPPSEQGLMHRTTPGNYFCWWDGLHSIEEAQWDSEGLWIGTYLLEDITTYGGGSGGPIYVRDDSNEWVMAGIVVGRAVDGTSVTVRGVDAGVDALQNLIGAWNWIEQAISARNQDALRRVDDLTVTASAPSSVSLQWTDLSNAEAGYYVYRQMTGTYELLATLPPGSTSYIDSTVYPGHVYHYRVQGFADNGNRTPKSKAIQATTSGNHSTAGLLLDQPLFQWSSSGDSSWFRQGDRLRAGKVRSMGSSSLYLDIIGPGTITFDWSASCEENPEYADPTSQYHLSIYDAVYLYLDGVQQFSGEEPVFLSGLSGPVTRQLDVPAGAHTVEWRYEKDPYTDEFEDTAFLDAFSWSPGPVDPYPVYAAYAVAGIPWHASTWFGDYDVRHWPWLEHSRLGWLYMLGGDGTGFYAYSELPGIGIVYVSLAYYPFIYQPMSGKWFYYIEGTGDFGNEVIFWDTVLETFLQFP